MEIEWIELFPVSSVTVIYESYPRDALKLEWHLIGKMARGLLPIVTMFFRVYGMRQIIKSTERHHRFPFSTRENQVYASDKWYLIKLYCANNDHSAFGSTRPDFYSSTLDNWYFRGHEHRYLCAIEPCKIPLSSCLRIIDRNLDIYTLTRLIHRGWSLSIKRHRFPHVCLAACKTGAVTIDARLHFNPSKEGRINDFTIHRLTLVAKGWFMQPILPFRTQ